MSQAPSDPLQGTSTLPGGSIEAQTKSKSQLEDLIAQATAKYAVKEYDAAAELYSRGTELQAEINGEMSTQNADLLYYYGRCLYHVAVSKSDVLGTKVAGEKKEKNSRRRKSKAASGSSLKNTKEDHATEEPITAVVEEEEAITSAAKPYFNFTGDDNWDDSDEEEEEEAEGGEEQEADVEEDDFLTAYEILDLARVLLRRKLEELESSSERNKRTETAEVMKQVKERLADTHDLQAEISLEGERFPSAVEDLRVALELKQELFPQESSLIAEAHFKLSLALEFSSVTQQTDEDGRVIGGQQTHVDEGMREEAAKEMEAAIESCRMRIEKEDEALKGGHWESKKGKITRESIDDVKDMVKDMEQRLIELRQPPVSINDSKGAGSIDGANPLSGILGSILGESSEAQKARLEEASKTANDLTRFVRKKQPVSTAKPSALPEAATNNGTPKRKVDLVEATEGISNGKKAKL